jgi:hypothetical protein
MTTDTILLGRLTKSLPRSKAHSNYVNSLIQTITDNIDRRGGKLPTVKLAQELRDCDLVVVEDKESWTPDLSRIVNQRFPNVEISTENDSAIELYVPLIGVPPAFAWKDFAASISVASLCGYLLYYFVF